MTQPAPFTINALNTQPAKIRALLRQAQAASLAEATPPAPAPGRTPRRLRQYRLASVMVMVAFGVFGATQLAQLQADLADAPAVSAQYAQLAEVRIDLIQAAELATQSSLAGSANDKVPQDLSDAATGLIATTKARPQDADMLSRANQALLDYSRLLLNANGAKPATAAGSLDAARTVLDKQLLPALDTIQGQLSTEAGDVSWARNGTFAGVSAAIALALLIAIWVDVARRSHRVVNLGLAGAAVAAIVIASVCFSSIGNAAGADHTARITKLAQIRAVATTQEALHTGALLQASGAMTQHWSAANTSTVTGPWSTDSLSGLGISSDVTRAVAGVSTAQDKINTALSASNWSQAGQLVTGSAANQALSSLDAAVGAQITKATAAAAKAPGTAGAGMLPLIFLVGALGLGGAWLAAWGLGQRVKEYR